MPVDRRSIGRTLTRHVLLVGVVAAALACLLLLTRIYLDEREAMQAHLREVESSQLPPLTAALWEVDPQRIDALLDGIAVRPGVSEVVLNSAEGEQWRSGVGAEPVWMQARFPLTHASQPDRPLGELEVHIGRSHGLARVMRQLPLLLLIVLGSMLGAAWVISRQFRQRVSEPLAELARYAEGLSGEALDRPLQWSRRRVGGSEDEIDQLVRAFNDMRERLHQGISRQAEQKAALRQQQQRLESEVAQRTQDLSERLVQLTQAKSATDAARAQAEQLASRLADFADISADGFWETDADLRLVMVTPHFADLIGADLPDLLGKTPAEAYRARFPEAPDLEPYMRPLRERHEIEGQPLLLVDRHGARHWVINNGKPVYDANGDFLGYRGAITDITDNRRAERALQASERRFRLITDNVPALISYVDRQRLFRYNNKVYQDWLRMPLEQITDRSVADVYGAEVYRAIEPHLEAALGGQRSTFEIELQGRIYRATYVPDVDGQGDVAGAYGLIHDITRLKRVERDLRHAALYDGLTGLANRRH
ncbi:MAG: PAS domain-containing protein, partial [Xanthomonadales bacterium]|nr:PAS domain-containing protein [Xanthomonadales bacterium]